LRPGDIPTPKADRLWLQQRLDLYLAAGTTALAWGMTWLLGGPVHGLVQHALALAAVPASALAITAAVWLVRRPADLEPSMPVGCAAGFAVFYGSWAMLAIVGRLGPAFTPSPGAVLGLYALVAALLALTCVVNQPVFWRRRPDGRPTVLARVMAPCAWLVALAGAAFVGAAVLRLLL